MSPVTAVPDPGELLRLIDDLDSMSGWRRPMLARSWVEQGYVLDGLQALLIDDDEAAFLDMFSGPDLALHEAWCGVVMALCREAGWTRAHLVEAVVRHRRKLGRPD